MVKHALGSGLNPQYQKKRKNKQNIKTTPICQGVYQQAILQNLWRLIWILHSMNLFGARWTCKDLKKILLQEWMYICISHQFSHSCIKYIFKKWWSLLQEARIFIKGKTKLNIDLFFIPESEKPCFSTTGCSLAYWSLFASRRVNEGVNHCNPLLGSLQIKFLCLHP